MISTYLDTSKQENHESLYQDFERSQQNTYRCRRLAHRSKIDL